jgi:hypothetical protein
MRLVTVFFLGRLPDVSATCGQPLPVNVTLGRQHLHSIAITDPDPRLTAVGVLFVLLWIV